LDLDTFFVSVERLLEPSLIGKPVVVGGRPGQRGVVTAASYEVRAFGVRSGMSLTRAHQLAPQAIYLPTRHGVYGEYAARVREIAQSYTPVSQVASIDELFLDFSGCERVYARADDADGDATIERVVRELSAEIKARVGLPASAGFATSRAVAKVACGLAKPCGVLLVRAGQEGALLGPLPVRKFPGIGPVAEQKLHALGLIDLAQVAVAPPEHRAQHRAQLFGARAVSCRSRAAHARAPAAARDPPARRRALQPGAA
jgi:DNA polymerase-4